MSFSLFAQTTGKISGLIKDKSDSAPLPGAMCTLKILHLGQPQMKVAGLLSLIFLPGNIILKLI